MISICHTLAYFINYFRRHVHLDEPGRTEWEGFVTGTRAAAAGRLMVNFGLLETCLVILGEMLMFLFSYASTLRE